MATRLQVWLPSLISEMQSAFTGGRQIQDNIVIVHEVLNNFKKHKIGKKRDMMIKLDMKKAYDLVEWKCLLSLLKAYGFGEIWCSWSKECISTVRFNILFNRSPTEGFTPSRGIRQGDSLSPLLFILMTNALSFLVEKSIELKHLKGLKLNQNCPRLTHCLFAVDTVFFGEASLREAANLMKVIRDYGAFTGQEINTNKSSAFFSFNVNDEERQSISG
ncbi:unnamed protein product [Linum trigynum]|uniref:Reverse transcriptase domain-containing protein n=1 Tax=Linum trigynum TaxID=586398 RepID=A0AAV2FPH8_9ROSI